MRIISDVRHTEYLDIPKVITKRIKEIINILNKTYGRERNIFKDDGGYVLVIEYESELRDVPKYFEYIKKQEPELVKKISTEEDCYLEVLYLMHNEHGVNLFLKKEWASPNIINAI